MIDRNKPLWQLTVGELLDILNEVAPKSEVEVSERKLVYGLQGIADLFGCSIATAHRIKKSGKIKKAITQVGRKIVVNSELALKLYSGK